MQIVIFIVARESISITSEKGSSIYFIDRVEIKCYALNFLVFSSIISTP